MPEKSSKSGNGRNFFMNFTQMVIITIFVLTGIFVFVSPILKCVNKKAYKKSSETLYKSMQEEKEEAEEKKEESAYDRVYEKMKKYNDTLYDSEQARLDAQLPQIGDSTYAKTKEGIDLKLFGYIKINGNRETKILHKSKKNKEKTYPISFEVTKKSLTNGFVPVKQTSLPIGGKNTLSVLYGKPKDDLGAEGLFDIHIGDKITVVNLWDELKYAVDELLIVGATDTEFMKIRSGEDNLILLIGDERASRRYCIVAKRISKTFDEQTTEDD